ncbi:Predicted dehydrogenase [Gracilibacillus orientalis]|uniref:Predicted dehydrogenase n=1 Tax=Gracilibacillus orientalis TaxID=334253 RepID=A0A1I4IBR2_9BACI|nr:Gfo/Idh/MocA family oxidoreductase [Gracilibacillus orientalis]SFL51838.1 Predicted dehydrogenase [Gracilibacillus orientalis]
MTTKHQIIVAGCGGMANVWLDYVEQRDNADIVGLVDLNKEVAQKKADQRKLQVPIFTDLATAIKDTEANLVFDVTIPAAHKQIVTTALEAGCNVFGEKPMAESLQDGLEITQISERTSKAYSVMQNRRYLKEIRSLRHFIENNELGKVHTLNVDFYLGPHFGGFREQMEHPLIVDMAIHTFDQARYISNSNAVSVYCHEYNPEGSWYAGNASAICIFEMEDGSVFTFRGSWAAEGLQTSWNGDWHIIGTRGTAKWDGFDHLTTETVKNPDQKAFFKETEKRTISNKWTGNEQHAGCLDEMFLALEENRHAETDCHDNIHSMKMVFAAVESAKKREKVYL